MGEIDGKKKQVSGASQGRDGDSTRNGNSAARRNGESARFVGKVGVNSQNRSEGDSNRIGGILAQLIEECEDQLGDAERCIARLNARLQKLKRLQELQQQATKE